MYNQRFDKLDKELNPCEVCAEPGELYLGGHTYCPEHADRAGRNGYQ